MKYTSIFWSALALSAFSFIFAAQSFVFAQNGDNSKKVSSDTKRYRSESLDLLDEIKDTLKEHYFDPKYRGLDLDARFAAAKERIKTLEYNWQMYRVLVQVLMDLNDSHTSFRMPPRTDFFDYGFSMQMIGHDCLVVSVKKDSDAEKKGLAVGHKIVSIGKIVPNRENLWKVIYLLYKLDPSKSVGLKVEALDGSQKSLTVDAKTMTLKERRAEIKNKKSKEKLEPYKCSEINPSLIACKLYTFVTDKGQIDKMMKEVGTHQKLILDLRGNSGGYITTEEHLVGYFFTKEVKIADVITRKKTESRLAKSRADKVFKGELLVLVDSRSASASEMFSRVIQIEKRGKVVGDVTSGAVMASIYVPLFRSASALADIIVSSVGMSVTVADVVMSDGGRLEHTGVVPDVPIVPNGLALSKKVDAVLSYAAHMFGAELTPEDAGKLRFITDKSDDEDLSDDAEDK